MKEPGLIFCTQRDGYDGIGEDPAYIDLECRFDDGQKFAAVRIHKEFANMANAICDFLNKEYSKR